MRYYRRCVSSLTLKNPAYVCWTGKLSVEFAVKKPKQLAAWIHIHQTMNISYDNSLIMSPILLLDLSNTDNFPFCILEPVPVKETM
jgi:hypothetical protein